MSRWKGVSGPFGPREAAEGRAGQLVRRMKGSRAAERNKVLKEILPP